MCDLISLLKKTQTSPLSIIYYSFISSKPYVEEFAMNQGTNSLNIYLNVKIMKF
jgi:hypothetical protein